MFGSSFGLVTSDNEPRLATNRTEEGYEVVWVRLRADFGSLLRFDAPSILVRDSLCLPQGSRFESDLNENECGGQTSSTGRKYSEK